MFETESGMLLTGSVVVVVVVVRYAARQVPRQVLLDAWPGDLLLERLLGRARQPS